MASDITREQIEALRKEHIGRLLLRAYRAFSESAYQKLCGYGHDGLSITHTTLLANLDTEGTPIKILAQRAGVSKQAMGQLVADLEQKGYIQRQTNPADHRETLIKFTEGGWKFLADAYRVKQEIDAEYTAILGPERMEALRSALTMLVES